MYPDGYGDLVSLSEDDSFLAGLAGVDALAGVFVVGVEGLDGDTADGGFCVGGDGVFGGLGSVPVGEDEASSAFALEGGLEFFPGVDSFGVGFAEGEGFVVDPLVESGKFVGEGLGEVGNGDGDFLAGVSAGDGGFSFGEVSGSDFDAEADSAEFPVVEFESRGFFFAFVDVDSDGFIGERPGPEVAGEVFGGVEDGFPVFAPADGDDDDLDGSEAWGADEAVVVAVGHDEGADESGGDSPAGGVDVFEFPVLVLEGDVEGFGELLSEVVRGSGLDGAKVLGHGLDGVGVVGTGEFFAI